MKVRQLDVVDRSRRLRMVVVAVEIPCTVRGIFGSTWHLRSTGCACVMSASPCTVWHIGGHLPQLQLQLASELIHNLSAVVCVKQIVSSNFSCAIMLTQHRTRYTGVRNTPAIFSWGRHFHVTRHLSFPSKSKGRYFNRWGRIYNGGETI